MNPDDRMSIAISAFPMLVTRIPKGVVNHDEMSTRLLLPVAAASPRKSGAKPRVEISQPDNATHWRIQITNPEKTSVKPMPPPSTRLWKT